MTDPGLTEAEVKASIAAAYVKANTDWHAKDTHLAIMDAGAAIASFITPEPYDDVRMPLVRFRPGIDLEAVLQLILTAVEDCDHMHGHGAAWPAAAADSADYKCVFHSSFSCSAGGVQIRLLRHRTLGTFREHLYSSWCEGHGGDEIPSFVMHDYDTAEKWLLGLGSLEYCGFLEELFRQHFAQGWFIWKSSNAAIRALVGVH